MICECGNENLTRVKVHDETADSIVAHLICDSCGKDYIKTSDGPIVFTADSIEKSLAPKILDSTSGFLPIEEVFTFSQLASLKKHKVVDDTGVFSAKNVDKDLFSILDPKKGFVIIEVTPRGKIIAQRVE